MKKRFLAVIILSVIVATFLVGCSAPKEEPITNKEESTVIKNATNVDEYLKNDDYKSVAYAFIYNIKSGLNSYESETNGTVKARILFFDYNIKYNSVIYKSGNTFYSKDDSTSTLMNIQNEFYMVDDEKILVSRDLKKYDVYTLDDYRQISYSPNQYSIMGYVFNDQSIADAELVSDADDAIKIKYTLDNELATNLVKLDLKCNGGLSSYPEFKKIEITLKMQKDFTPISYSIYTVYDASKPVIGSAEVTQEAECLFSKVNEDIVIPNEEFLIKSLGTEPTKIKTDDEEEIIKSQLSDAAKNLDLKDGVNVDGYIALNLIGEQTKLDIDANLAVDLARLSEEKIYNILSFYGKVEGDEMFNSIVNLVKSFAGEQLEEYALLLDNFKQLEIVYDGNGALYLIPTNQSDVSPAVLKIKLTDIADIVLKQINVYNLVAGANTDLLSFKKAEEKDENNYKVEVSLNEETVNSIKYGIEQLFEDDNYSMLKTLLNYKDFHSVNIGIEVVDGLLKNLDASFKYVTNDDEDDSPATLIELHLEAGNKTFDFASKIEPAEHLYDSYTSIAELKTRIDELLNNVYVSNLYLTNLEKAYDEYKALSDEQKSFFQDNVEKSIQDAAKQVGDIRLFLETYGKYDLDNLTNEDIYSLAKAYALNYLNSRMLIGEIGQENYRKLDDLGSLVDYTAFDSALSKFTGDDENSWGLTEQEILDIKLILDISDEISSVSTQLYFKLILAGKTMNVSDLKTKINNLYSNLAK